MSIELITGKSATAHISANDFRAINRANYGPGRYILKDADNMQAEMYANGTIHILRGSCMWSGMHIRCENPTILNFTPPTTRASIGVYLHYVKDVETLNESVEWVVSVGGDPSPMVDNVADNTMEAYTLFCYATMQTDGTIGDTIYKFKLLDSFHEIEKLIAYAHEEVVLFNGESRVHSDIPLSESFRNFYELEFIGGDDSENAASSARVLVSQIEDVGGILGVTLVGADKWSNEVDGFTILMPWKLRIKSDDSFFAEATSRSLVEGSVSRRENGYISKIIGVGRRR